MKIGDAKISCPLSNVKLDTRFAIHSFLCIGIMATALWLIVSNYIIRQILVREWETTARIVRGNVRQLLDDYDFKAVDRNSVGHKFETLLRNITLIPEIVRIKVYNSKGVVIWSDDKRLVGQSFEDNDELEAAIRGNVVADMSALNKEENKYEQESFEGLVEVYVPIFAPRNGDLLGVIEIYRRADSIFRDLRKARTVVLMGALGGGLLLYLSLFAIVRQAARKIDEQQKNLLAMQTELVASQRMAAVGEVAAAVAHGIGNPLSSIRAAAQVAILNCMSENGTCDNKKMEVNLHSIMQQVDRVQKRMQGLLNFAKPLDPRPVPVEVNLLLREVIETLSSRIEQAEVTSRLELESNLPKTMFDVNHLEQIFMGLITNAIEATPKGGQVTIRTGRSAQNGHGNKIHVTIEDTGEGIPQENQERVFEPFFTTKPHGTGIGLALAKKFVERNGGILEIAGAGSGGTRMRLTLPLPRDH